MSPSNKVLGCKGPRPGTPHPSLAKLNLTAVDFPAEFSWNDNPYAAQSIARVFRNAGENALGTCVPAAMWHIIGIQAGKDAHRLVAPTDAQIEDLYIKACGPGNLGCYTTDTVYYGKFFGLPCGNEVHSIDDFLSIAYWDDRFIKACILLFGGVLIGMNFPEEWFSTNVWAPTTSKIVGGHMVGGFGWTRQGVRIATWGGERILTWEVFPQLAVWVFQMLAFYGPDWYNADMLTPLGFTPGVLKQDLVDLGRSIIPPLTPGQPWVLASGDTLQAGQGRLSQDGRFWFVMQGDGNLVLYQGSKALWNSGTFGQPGTYTVMQPDGNLVIYGSSVTQPGGNKGPWSTWTFGHPGSTLVVQNDGNVVIYEPTGKPIWWTGTFGK